MFLYLDRTETERGEVGREETGAVIPVACDIIARSKHRSDEKEHAEFSKPGSTCEIKDLCCFLDFSLLKGKGFTVCSWISNLWYYSEHPADSLILRPTFQSSVGFQWFCDVRNCFCSVLYLFNVFFFMFFLTSMICCMGNFFTFFNG